MNKTEKKKIFCEVLDPILISKGYKSFKSGGAPSYVLKKDHLIIHFFFTILDMGGISVSPICITDFDVEDFILEIEFPDIDLGEYQMKKKLFLPMVHEVTIKKSFEKWYALKDIDYSYPFKVDTPEAVKLHTQALLNYLENEGAAFVKKFSYLPNILKEMDNATKRGDYWADVLSGGPEHLMRGIIISKLCNDPDYSNKLDWVEKVFTTMDLDEWLPHWEKLKKILPSIEPKYPYCK